MLHLKTIVETGDLYTIFSFKSEQLQMSFNPTENNQEGASPDNLGFDKAALNELFKKHYPLLCIYCKLKYGFDIHQAEDVVNSSFIKLWETRQTIASDMSPKAYLYKIADNISLNILRHERVKDRHAAYMMRTTSEDVSETGFDSIDLKQLSSAIDAAISELPEQMRIIFELRKNEGLKYAEIASRLNISVKTVDTQVRRAMIKLRDKLSAFLTFIFILVFSMLIKK